jgi:hypothetical protein
MPESINAYLTCTCDGHPPIHASGRLDGNNQTLSPADLPGCTANNCTVMCSSAEHTTVSIISDDFSGRRAIDYGGSLSQRRKEVQKHWNSSDPRIAEHHLIDEVAWLRLASCATVWLPTSLFSVTAAAAAGSRLHLAPRYLARMSGARRDVSHTSSCSQFRSYPVAAQYDIPGSDKIAPNRSALYPSYPRSVYIGFP